MARRFFYLAAAVAVAVSAAACSDQPDPSAPQDGPSFVKVTPLNACTFTGNPSLSNAANDYFTTTADRKTASDLITVIQDSFSTPRKWAAARNPGYDLLSFTGQVAKLGTGSPAPAGSALVQQTVRCMFDIDGSDASLFPNWPSGSQWDFDSALETTTGGAFFVRGGTNDNPNPVIADDADGNISGIAPPSNPASTWTIMSNRALLYGNTVTGGYDWKLIPNTTTFSPYVVVALCRVESGTDMVHQQSVGVIEYKGEEAATICSTDRPSALRIRSPLERLAEFASRMFAPTPAQAAIALSTIGGSASGAKGDEFTSFPLPNVVLTVVSQPTQVKLNTKFGFKVNVKTPDGEPAGGITVSLSAITNNGTGTGIFQVSDNAPRNFVCDPTQSYISGPPSETTVGTVAPPGGTPDSTNAVFANLCISKTGGVSIVATASAKGNETQGQGTVTSARINVKP